MQTYLLCMKPFTLTRFILKLAEEERIDGVRVV